MEALRQIFIDRIGLKEKYYQQFMASMHVRKLNRREMLVAAGTTYNFIGFVNSGILRSFVTRNEEECNTDFYFQHYFVSAYSSFITQTPTEHSIEAITPCEIFCLSHQQYEDLIKEDVEWLRFGKYIAEFFLIRKCQRELSFLKMTAFERMEAMLKQYPDIEQLIPQYHIASYLGIKPESLSRIKQFDYLGERAKQIDREVF
jgi:CRP-like cAMP-binding protein